MLNWTSAARRCQPAITRTVSPERHGGICWARLRARFWPSKASPNDLKSSRFDLPCIARHLPSSASDLYCYEQGIDDYRQVGLLEAFMIGWCPLKRRMRGWQYLNYSDYEPKSSAMPCMAT
jgi:hypothetical protein